MADNGSFPDYLSSLPRKQVDFLRLIYSVPTGWPASRLSQWLSDPDNLENAVVTLDRFSLSLLEILLALGPGRSRAALDDAIDGRAETDHVDDVLAKMRDVALIWPLRGNRWAVNPGLPLMIGMPCGLAPPSVDLMPEATVATLTGLARLFRVEPQRLKEPLVVQAVELLADPAAVGAALARLSPAAVVVAKQLAIPGRPLQLPWQGKRGQGVDELIQHGLIVVVDYTMGLLVREVALSVRGGRLSPELRPDPPVVGEAFPGTVQTFAGQAAAALVSDFQALLSSLAAAPVALLGTGVVGVKEMKRLTKALGCTEPQVALLLGLAGDAGLLDADGAVARPSRAAQEFGELTPVQQWLRLASTWLTSASPYIAGAAPLTNEDRRPPREFPPVLLLTLLTSDRRVTPRNVRTLLEWRMPLVRTATDDLVAAIMTEAELLGLTHEGVLSAAGVLLANDPAAAAETLAAELPTLVNEVILQGDLTATTTGPPTAELSRLLDGSADRETRGHASVWRFTAATVRRYLDAGHSAESLLSALSERAARGVPNALTALVGDAARRQGEVELHSAVTVLVARDPAIAATMLNDRRLAKLQLSGVAPTVLISASAEDVVLDLVRKSGFSPTAVKSGPQLVSADLEKLVRKAMGPARSMATALIKQVRAGEEVELGLMISNEFTKLRLRNARLDSVYVSGETVDDGVVRRFRLNAVFSVAP